MTGCAARTSPRSPAKGGEAWSADDRCQPQMMAVVQRSVGLPQVGAVVQLLEQLQLMAVVVAPVVVAPPATAPRSSSDVSWRRVSVENVSFLFACFFMARVYASRRLPFVVNVTAPVILTLGAQPQLIAVVQTRCDGLQTMAVVVHVHVIAVVSAVPPPTTAPRSSSEVSWRKVSVENVSFLFACFFMARFYASRRRPLVVNVTALLILTLGRTTRTAQRASARP